MNVCLFSHTSYFFDRQGEQDARALFPDLCLCCFALDFPLAVWQRMVAAAAKAKHDVAGFSKTALKKYKIK